MPRTRTVGAGQEFPELSVHESAAIHVDSLPSDVAGVFMCQTHDDMRNITGPTYSSHWSDVHKRGPLFGWQRNIQHVGLDCGGRDAIDRHAKWTQLQRQTPGEADDACLCCSIC